MKLFDSEIAVMELLWDNGAMTASEISKELKLTKDWSTTTTYTIIKKCVEKGAIGRSKPKFLCTPLVTREEIQSTEVKHLVDRLFHGKTDQLLASLISGKILNETDINKLMEIISKCE